MLEVPGRLFTTWESVLEGRGRLITEGGTVLEKPGTLTTWTTVLQGPMMLLTTGATVWSAHGDCFFISLYNGKPNEALGALRYMRFCEQVSCQIAHGQPQDWKGWASKLVPEEFKWGWKIKEEGKMLPIQTSLSPAPIKLMEITRCNCKAGCSTGRCTCKKMDYIVHMHVENVKFEFGFSSK